MCFRLRRSNAVLLGDTGFFMEGTPSVICKNTGRAAGQNRGGGAQSESVSSNESALLVSSDKLSSLLGADTGRFFGPFTGGLLTVVLAWPLLLRLP